ncbi:hypothetical protein BCR34DRAFT_595395 [Clohesyomyces aquaticus]|uniref:Uncharacterized protein n=1 Tax=Clohesyomyces aquaticus TaxID=1231657 RepID=A0A1Y2AA46_9PLEO|nr:hypothetical protein BCR34DRAFT_595395 [Clohesyomyces aquaticus]
MPAPNMDNDSNGDSGSDGGHEEPNGFTLDVNSALQIRGNGSIIGFTPVNAAEVARDTVRHLHESGYLQIDPREAQGRRRGQFQININSGVTVIGNQNIVGNGLDEVARQARIQRERGQLNMPGAGQPPRRIIDGVLQPPGNNGQQAGRGQGRGQLPQGQAPGAGRGAGAGRGSGQGPWPLDLGGSPRLTQPGPGTRPLGQDNNGNPT